MSGMVSKKLEKGEAIASDKTRPIITYVMTTETPDRDNETVNPEGGDFHEFALNPTVQFNHDTDTFGVGSMAMELAGPIPDGAKPVHPGIAVWNDYIGEGTKYPHVLGPKRLALLGNVYYDLVDEKSQTAYRKARAGTFKGGSISFNPVGPVTRGAGGGSHYDKWKLLEFTVCSIGSNPDAVKVSKSLSTKAELVLKTPSDTKNLILFDDEVEQCGLASCAKALKAGEISSLSVAKAVLGQKSDLAEELNSEVQKAVDKLHVDEWFITNSDGYYWTVQRKWSRNVSWSVSAGTKDDPELLKALVDAKKSDSSAKIDTRTRRTSDSTPYGTGGRKPGAARSMWEIARRSSRLWMLESAGLKRSKELVDLKWEDLPSEIKGRLEHYYTSGAEHKSLDTEEKAPQSVSAADYDKVAANIVSAMEWNLKDIAKELRRVGSKITVTSHTSQQLQQFKSVVDRAVHDAKSDSDLENKITNAAKTLMLGLTLSAYTDAHFNKEDLAHLLFHFFKRFLRDIKQFLRRWGQLRVAQDPGTYGVSQRGTHRMGIKVRKDPRLNQTLSQLRGGKIDADQMSSILARMIFMQRNDLNKVAEAVGVSPNKVSSDGELRKLIESKLHAMAGRGPKSVPLGQIVEELKDRPEAARIVQTITAVSVAAATKLLFSYLQTHGFKIPGLDTARQILGKLASYFHKSIHMKKRKCWIKGKTAVLLKSEGEDLDQATQDYLEQRGLQNVHIEDKGPDEFDELDKDVPTDKGELVDWAKEEEAEHKGAGDMPTDQEVNEMAMKAEEAIDTEEKDLDEAVEEAMDESDVDPHQKRWVRKAINRVLKRFVVKVGKYYVTKSGISALSDGQLDPQKPISKAEEDGELTKDIDEAAHMDEKTAKVKSEELNEDKSVKKGEWPSAKTSEDLTQWQFSGHPSSGPDSLGNTTGVSGKWPGLTTKKRFAVRLKSGRFVCKAGTVSDVDDAEVMTAAKAEEVAEERDGDVVKVTDGEDDLVDKFSLNPFSDDKAFDEDEPVDKFSLNPFSDDKALDDDEPVDKFSLNPFSDDKAFDEDEPTEKRYIVKVGKLYVAKGARLTKNEEAAEEMSLDRAQKAADALDGEIETKSDPADELDDADKACKILKAGHLDGEPLSEAQKSVVAAMCCKKRRLRKQLCADCIGEKSVCGCCVKRITKVLKATPPPPDGAEDENIPKGLRSLRKLCKAMEDDAAQRDPGPVREAIEMALKILHKARGKVYKDYETEDEVEKRKSICAKSDDNDADDMELKSTEPPHIEHGTDGYSVHQGEQKVAGPFKEKEDAVDDVKKRMYTKARRQKSAGAISTVAKRVRKWLEKAADEVDDENMKGLMFVKAKELADAEEEEKRKSDDGEDLTEEEKALLKRKFGELEDTAKRFLFN